MRNRLLVLIALVAAASAALAAGKMYRWTDAQGRVHYSDAPADGARDVQVVHARPGSGAQSTAAGEDAEATTARRAEQCTAKRDQLASYQNAVRVVERDSLGREHEYSAQERDQLIARTQSEIDSVCDQPQG